MDTGQKQKCFMTPVSALGLEQLLQSLCVHTIRYMVVVSPKGNLTGHARSPLELGSISCHCTGSWCPVPLSTQGPEAEYQPFIYPNRCECKGRFRFRPKSCHLDPLFVKCCISIILPVLTGLQFLCLYSTDPGPGSNSLYSWKETMKAKWSLYDCLARAGVLSEQRERNICP